MSNKPIFVATHPRACSTAFERVFMTRRDTLQCVHEPFGDAFYFGPERLSSRYEANEHERIDSGFQNSTYQKVVDRLGREGAKGKRLFIKDITHYLVPPDRKPASIAPSLSGLMHGAGSGELIANGLSDGSTTAPYPYHTVAEPGNPTVVPHAILKKFHFTFLIRHPRLSIPSYYRCTVPPLDKMTGFYDFMPSEAGYGELRRVFDYLHSNNLIGPKIAGLGAVGTENKSNSITNSDSGHVEICVIDADDLLDNPSGIIEAYCKSVAIDYDPEMLRWDTPEDHQQALDTFEKWKGFHEDAINSTQLRARLHAKKTKNIRDEDAEWREKFGEKGATVIRDTVDRNIADYEYLKQFALKV